MSPDPTPTEEIQSVERPGAADTPPQLPAPPAAAPAAVEPATPAAAQASTTLPPPPAPPAPEGDLPPAPPPAQVPAPSEPKVMPAEWPCAGYSGPQPWEADNPPALTQNRLMIGSGSAGQEVVELASYLAYLGYGTSISSGQNPHEMFDDTIRAAVAAFCADYGISEDPKVLQARTQDTVGPWLWEALVRAVHKKAAEAPAQEA